MPILKNILLVIISAAIGHGIVIAFSLDAKVASAITSTMQNPPDLRGAFAWIIPGVFGLIVLIAWIYFQVDRRLAEFSHKAPAQGSLSYSDFVANIRISRATGSATVEAATELQNLTGSLIKFEAILKGEVNGRRFVAPDNNPFLKFSGYVNPNGKNQLILRIPEVVPSTDPHAPTFNGIFEYDLRYSFAGSRRLARRTGKTISYETHLPATGAAGDTAREGIKVLFSNEVEE